MRITETKMKDVVKNRNLDLVATLHGTKKVTKMN